MSSISHKIESFHNDKKTKSSYDKAINEFVDEYASLNKSEVRKEVIDDVFKILCGKSLEDIITYNGSVKDDTIIIQQETIEELKTNYWNLRQQLLKKTGK